MAHFEKSSFAEELTFNKVFSEVSSILSKATVQLLILKLTAVKAHFTSCTIKHILSSELVCSSFKKDNFVV